LSAHCEGAVPEIWDIYRRYSDFQELAKELKKLKCRIPTLPPKNPFGFQDESFLKVGWLCAVLNWAMFLFTLSNKYDSIAHL
jgi:hypothetical protein